MLFAKGDLSGKLALRYVCCNWQWRRRGSARGFPALKQVLNDHPAQCGRHAAHKWQGKHQQESRSQSSQNRIRQGGNGLGDPFNGSKDEDHHDPGCCRDCEGSQHRPNIGVRSASKKHATTNPMMAPNDPNARNAMRSLNSMRLIFQRLQIRNQPGELFQRQCGMQALGHQ
jgi:hypothetical protein